MTEQFTTEGERRLGRLLAKERRAGVEHYVTGQHHAEIVEEDTHVYAALSFVNVMGHAVFVLCRRAPRGEWDPWKVFGEFGQGHVFKLSEPPESWDFSVAMLAALDEAERRWDADSETQT